MKMADVCRIMTNWKMRGKKSARAVVTKAVFVAIPIGRVNARVRQTVLYTARIWNDQANANT